MRLERLLIDEWTTLAELLDINIGQDSRDLLLPVAPYKRRITTYFPTPRLP